MARRIEMNSRGQMAIWIILAIVLVAAIVIFFTLYRGPTIFRPLEPGPVDVESYIERCVEDHTLEAVNIMLPQGGFIEPKNYEEFNNTKVEYLCENILSYDPCINQHPMLMEEMKSELYDSQGFGGNSYLEGRIVDCFEGLKREVEKRRGTVVYGPQAVTIDLGEDRIWIKVKRPTTVTREEETRTYEEFNVEVISPAYNLAEIAMEIAAQEAKYCAFDPVGYSLSYPRYSIRRYPLPDATKIYIIKDKRTGKFMMTATRSCAIPPGL